MSDQTAMRKALHEASSKPRPPAPPKDTAVAVLDLLRRVWQGEIAEFRVVSTRRGVDAFETKKRRL